MAYKEKYLESGEKVVVCELTSQGYLVRRVFVDEELAERKQLQLLLLLEKYKGADLSVIS